MTSSSFLPVELLPIDSLLQKHRAWATQLVNELQQYTAWLLTKKTDADCLRRADALQQQLSRFIGDRFRIVMVGEFGRGKTELLNALLGDTYLARLFPTRVGRTTMCAVEVFEEPNIGPYLKLLPTETRGDNQPLSFYRQRPQAWFQTQLNPDDVDNMRQALREVTRTREVPNAQAHELGFNLEFLEASISQPGYVHIPAWRHALVNIKHPFLAAGLAFIDTPGINAPGVEADLAAAVLPEADAVLYLLSAETGVSASDYQLWSQKIAPASTQYHTGLFALLNKIDILESDEEPIVESVQRLIRISAQQLALAPAHIVPLSARHALKALQEKNETRLRRSGFNWFKEKMVPAVILERETLLYNQVIYSALQDIERDKQQTQQHIKTSLSELALLTQQQQQANEHYLRAQRSTFEQQRHVEQRLQLWQQFNQVMQHNISRTKDLTNAARFESHLTRAHSVLGITPNMTSVVSAISVMISGVRLDLRRLRSDLESWPAQAEQIWQQLMQLSPTFSDLGLDDLLTQLGQIERRYTIDLPLRQRHTEPQEWFKREFVPELHQLYQQFDKRLNQWETEAVTPLNDLITDEQTQLRAQYQATNSLQEQIAQRTLQISHLQEQQPALEDDLRFLQHIQINIEHALKPS